MIGESLANLDRFVMRALTCPEQAERFYNSYKALLLEKMCPQQPLQAIETIYQNLCQNERCHLPAEKKGWLTNLVKRNIQAFLAILA